MAKQEEKKILDIRLPEVLSLDAEAGSVATKIKAMLDKKKALEASGKTLSEEDIGELRNGYTLIYSIANSIINKLLSASFTLNEDETRMLNTYKARAENFLAKSRLYGSAMRGIPSRTFDDIAGLDEVKEVVDSFVYMAEHPELLSHYNMEGGLGLLMYGAPGTGKTMFAEAAANRMKLPLFVVTPADIYNSYVGQSEKAVRDIFDEMDNCRSGAVLFVDECESIFSKRTGNDETWKSSVTTELLQRMNGFGRNGSRRVLLASTNRPDKIDPAYLRYKRFTNLVHVPPPDVNALRAIIEHKLRIGKPDEIELHNISVEQIVEMTQAHPGYYYTGADISGIIEEACRQAIDKMIKTRNESGKFLPLEREYFERAFAKKYPSVSRALADQYENFSKHIDSSEAIGEEKKASLAELFHGGNN